MKSTSKRRCRRAFLLRPLGLLLPLLLETIPLAAPFCSRAASWDNAASPIIAPSSSSSSSPRRSIRPIIDRGGRTFCCRRRPQTTVAFAATTRDETTTESSSSLPLPSNASTTTTTTPEEEGDDELGTTTTTPSTGSGSNTAAGVGSTAIVLNMNARSVSPPLIALANSIVGEENVFVTRTVEDAACAARTVVRCRHDAAKAKKKVQAEEAEAESARVVDNTNSSSSEPANDDEKNDHVPPLPPQLRGYSLVVPVGGDGTLSGWIDTMVDEILSLHEQENNETANATMSVEEAIRQLPLVGYIPMGTGNGLGYVIGCKVAKGEGEPSTAGDKDSLPIMARMNVPARMRRRKLDRFRRTMARLKEVGDAICEAERANRRFDGIAGDAVPGRCSVVEMPLMEVTHPPSSSSSDDDGGSTTTTTTKSPPPGEEAKGDLCFFAGAGFDSLMLHDFKRIKAWSTSPSSAAARALPAFVRDALTSVAGYCVALVTRTLPRALRHGTHKIHVDVTTHDDDALWVDHRRGDFSEPAVPPRRSRGGRGEARRRGLRDNNDVKEVVAVVGDKDGSDDPGPEEGGALGEGAGNDGDDDGRERHLVYSGTTGIVAASTTPYYGGGMRLFPYARLFPDRLHLRLGRISPLTGFLNIPSIFEGSYRERGGRSFGCLDFVGREFEVEVRGVRFIEYVRRKREEKREARRRRREMKRGNRRNRSDGSEKDDGDGRDEDHDDDDDGIDGEGQAVSRGFPFQHSGESMGVKERFRLRVVQEPVRFISFLEPRVVVDD